MGQGVGAGESAMGHSWPPRAGMAMTRRAGSRPEPERARVSAELPAPGAASRPDVRAVAARPSSTHPSSSGSPTVRPCFGPRPCEPEQHHLARQALGSQRFRTHRKGSSASARQLAATGCLKGSTMATGCLNDWRPVPGEPSVARLPDASRVRPQDVSNHTPPLTARHRPIAPEIGRNGHRLGQTRGAVPPPLTAQRSNQGV